MFKYLTLLTITFILSFSNVYSQSTLEEMSDNYCTVYKSKKTSIGTYCPLVSMVDYPNHFPKNGIKLIDVYVIVKLSVTKYGSTKNVEVMNSYYKVSSFKYDKNGKKQETITEVSPIKYLHRSAVKSSQKFKFKLKLINGEPIELDNMIIKLDYLP